MDPRLNLPSASKYGMVAECPGQVNLYSELLASGVAVKDSEPDEDASFGIKVHEARKTGNRLPLDLPMDEAYQHGVQIEQTLLQQWTLDFGIAEYVELPPMGERLFLHNPQTLDPVASGEIDVAYVSRPHALIVDWKALGGYYAPPATRNEQLRLYAVLLWKEMDGITNIRVAVDRCNEHLTATDFADYSEEDLKNSEQSIHYHLWATRQKDARRHAGPWCHFCPCAPHCVEAGAYTMVPSVIASRALSDVEEVSDMVAVMKPADLKKIFESKRTIEKIFEAVVARLKAMNDEQLAGLTLRKGKGQELLRWNDTEGAFNFLRDKGWPEKEIWACLEFGLGKLGLLVTKQIGVDEKYASKEVKSLLEKFFTVSEGEKILRKAR